LNGDAETPGDVNVAGVVREAVVEGVLSADRFQNITFPANHAELVPAKDKLPVWYSYPLLSFIQYSMLWVL